MSTRRSLLVLGWLVLGGLVLAAGPQVCAEPPLPGQLTALPLQTFSGSVNSTYNGRIYGDFNYVSQINTGSESIARFAWGGTSAIQQKASGAPEHRMNAPFAGASPAYVLAAGGASNSNLSRYDFSNYANRVDVAAPSGAGIVESFDWVDANTIIADSYQSGQRNRLYLMDIVADPFGATTNTTWNANGYVTTPVTTRIRNVRAGKTFTGYAYYGDAGNNSDPKFYALNLATGASTELGGAGTLTGSGSFGLWTVAEADGYLFVQTTDNGVQVYQMTDATTLGPLFTTYTKSTIDGLFPGQASAQYWGFDVSPDGLHMVLSGSGGRTYQIYGVPEPSAFHLMAVGLGCLALPFFRRRLRAA